jgi:hypothetical protein
MSTAMAWACTDATGLTGPRWIKYDSGGAGPVPVGPSTYYGSSTWPLPYPVVRLWYRHGAVPGEGHHGQPHGTVAEHCACSGTVDGRPARGIVADCIVQETPSGAGPSDGPLAGMPTSCRTTVD